MSEAHQAAADGRGRRLNTSASLLLRTCRRTARVFADHDLRLMVPVFMFLLLFGLLLAFLNTIAPLAPFVYSLI